MQLPELMINLCQITNVWVSNKIWSNKSRKTHVDQGDREPNITSVHQIKNIKVAKNNRNHDTNTLSGTTQSMENIILDLTRELKVVVKRFDKIEERLGKTELNSVAGTEMKK